MKGNTILGIVGAVAGIAGAMYAGEKLHPTEKAANAIDKAKTSYARKKSKTEG